MANKNAAGAAASSEKQGKENTKPAPVSKMAKLKRDTEIFGDCDTAVSPYRRRLFPG